MIDSPANQEALDTLLRTLALNEGFLLLPVRCDIYPQARELAEWLDTQGFQTTLLAPIDDDWSQLLTELLKAPRGSGHVILLFARPSQHRAQIEGLRGINQQRDPLIQALGCPLLWCGPSSFHEQSWSCMPDMWSIRAVHLELAPPPPEALPTAQPQLELFSWLQPEDLERDAALLAQTQGDPRAAARLRLRLIEGHLGQRNLSQASTLLEALQVEHLTTEDALRAQFDRAYLALLADDADQARVLLETLDPPERYVPRALYLWLRLTKDDEPFAAPWEQLVASIEEGSSTDLGDIRELALALHHLSIRQASLGLREEAFRSAEQATTLYRQLAQERPRLFEPYLASSLNNLGISLSEMGQHEAALDAAQEAVELRRSLAASRPDVFLPALAGSLNSLGIRLSAMGQREAALNAAQEAVEIYKNLAASRPEAFLPSLSMSLTNLGGRLSAMGQREAALNAAQEAVEIYKNLAASHPEAFLPDLATSLHNLGAGLYEVGQREAAFQTTQEAVELRRSLAASHPEAFLPGLAMSLHNLGAGLYEMGQQEEGLQTTQEAVELRRSLAASRPEAFLPDLAASLNNLGAMLSESSQREEALTAAQEAVTLRRRLAASRPEAYLPDLAMSLNNLGARLSELGQREEALAAAQESVKHYTLLMRAYPDVFMRYFVGSIQGLLKRLEENDMDPESNPTLIEALPLLKSLSS